MTTDIFIALASLCGAVSNSIYCFNNSVNWSLYNTVNTFYVLVNFTYH